VLGGRKVPTEMKVELASKPGEYTKIVYRKLKFNVEIPSSKFTEQALSH
jgi:outer membrane lipoprotein-sorting protein